MNVQLVFHTITPEVAAAQAAAICTGSDQPFRALGHALKSGHDSVSEHASFTFKIEGVSRVLLAQITRHRLASFSVQSQRYCGVTPEWVVPPELEAKGFREDYLAECDRCWDAYQRYVAGGVDPEDARFVIPQGITCNLFMTMNARELRHFFSLRCCNRAQWEIRQLAHTMLRDVQEAFPKLFMDAGAPCVRGVCTETRPCGKGYQNGQ